MSLLLDAFQHSLRKGMPTSMWLCIYCQRNPLVLITKHMLCLSLSFLQLMRDLLRELFTATTLNRKTSKHSSMLALLTWPFQLKALWCSNTLFQKNPMWLVSLSSLLLWLALCLQLIMYSPEVMFLMQTCVSVQCLWVTTTCLIKQKDTMLLRLLLEALFSALDLTGLQTIELLCRWRSQVLLYRPRNMCVMMLGLLLIILLHKIRNSRLWCPLF